MPPEVAIPSEESEPDGIAKPSVPDTSAITFADPAVGGPSVLFFMGANGMGKTTTVGKVASRLREEGGQKVLLAAADTFRWDAVHSCSNSLCWLRSGTAVAGVKVFSTKGCMVCVQVRSRS